MRGLVVLLFAYITILGIGYLIDILEIPVEYKFMLAILISIVFLALIIRLCKRMSELENAIFVIVLIATLATSWVLRDVERGSLSPYTFIILLVLAGGFVRVVYLLIRTKREVVNHE
jgi:hypothetical protein